MEVDDEGGFVAERNKVSVTSELLEILKERGKPMRAEEMRDIFIEGVLLIVILPLIPSAFI